MLDHEERFLFREEILTLGTALSEPGQLDNVEDLLTDVITSPRALKLSSIPPALALLINQRAGSPQDRTCASISSTSQPAPRTPL